MIQRKRSGRTRKCRKGAKQAIMMQKLSFMINVTKYILIDLCSMDNKICFVT